VLPALWRDELIAGASHCDFESPTDWMCRMACGDTDRGRLLLGRYQVHQTVLHADGEGADWRLALLHHPQLAEFWKENLPEDHHEALFRIVPQTWIMEKTELPPTAVLHAPGVNGRPIREWAELAEASQRERNLIIKASGFHETAWGARSVTLGSDVSRDEWLEAIEDALNPENETFHVMQAYHKPSRLTHPVYADDGSIVPAEGRVRLCPYFFVDGDSTELSGILATFCPADKKIIHGMSDAALLPCHVVG
jgi:hypothetical protein